MGEKKIKKIRDVDNNMVQKELEKKEKPKELIRAEKLIDEAKHDEALQLIKHFEEREEHTLYEIVSCNLIKRRAHSL